MFMLSYILLTFSKIIHYSLYRKPMYFSPPKNYRTFWFGKNITNCWDELHTVWLAGIMLRTASLKNISFFALRAHLSIAKNIIIITFRTV